MPSYLFGNYLNHLVAAHFPGGRKGFADAGCEIVYIQVPGEKDLVYILTPAGTTGDLDLTAFKKAAEEVSKNHRMRLRWVTSINYNGNGLRALLALTQVSSVARQVDPEVVFFTRPTVLVIKYNGTKTDVEGLFKLIEGAKVVRRVVILSPAGVIERSWDFPENEPSEEEADEDGPEKGLYPPDDMYADDHSSNEASESVLEAAPDRGRPISLSDVADIASLVESVESVEDFLRRI